MNQKPTIYAAAAASLIILLIVFSLLFNYARRNENGQRNLADLSKEVDLDFSQFRMLEEKIAAEEVNRLPFAGSALDSLRRMLAVLAANSSALRKEAILWFDSEDEYNSFLETLGDRKFKLLGRSDSLRSLRVGFDSYGDLLMELATLDPSESWVETNFLVSLPRQPGTDNSPGAGDGAIPFGRDALQVLGINGDNSGFGKGVTVAVIDSGVQEHETFAGKGVIEFDLVTDSKGNEIPIDSDNGHGTAVASIIAGIDPRQPGVAPGADVLSYRVLDNDGYTDSFTLADAIVRATDAGADIINVSLGSDGDSGIVRRAVDYANSEGVLIVAATGNEGINSISFPAAIEGVVAVSANDARGQHVDFANSGQNLENGGMTAPGYEVWAAWPGGEAVSFSGTSASAPFVSGAVAAVMSENQGMSAHSAYQLLLQYSNEAGAPGSDRVYGVGNLDVGRVLERGTSDITDVGLASYYYDPITAAAAGTKNTAQVVVENRGTTAVHNLTVEVEIGVSERSYNVSFIPAGEIAVIETPIDLSAGAAEGGLKVSASVTVNKNLNDADRDTSDNSLSTVIELNSNVQR